MVLGNGDIFPSLGRDCGHKDTFSKTTEQATIARSFAFLPCFCISFAKKETREIKIALSVIMGFMHTACGRGNAGHTPQETVALTRGPSCHGWLVPVQGKHLGQTVHEKGRKVVFLPADHAVVRPFAPRRGCSVPHTKRDRRQPAGIVHSHLFFV